MDAAPRAGVQMFVRDVRDIARASVVSVRVITAGRASSRRGAATWPLDFVSRRRGMQTAAAGDAATMIVVRGDWQNAGRPADVSPQQVPPADARGGPFTITRANIVGG
jgi:hypothetical protein